MAKRRNDNGQMRKEEYDLDNETEEEAGIFKRASSKTMSKRKIVKARTRVKQAPKAAPIPANATNPFAQFKGLSSASSPATSTPPANPFSGFSGLSSSSSPAVLPKENTAPPSFKSTNNTVTPKKLSSYKDAMKELNDSFLDTIQCFVKDDPGCALEEVFADYEKYVTKLQKEHNFVPEQKSTPRTVAMESTTASTTTPTSATPFSFAASSEVKQSTPPPAKVASFMDTKPAAATVPSFMSMKKDTEAAPSGFSFYSKPATTAAAAAAPSASGFSFGSSTTATPAPVAADEESPEGVVEATVVLKDDSDKDEDCKLEIEKAKLMLRKESGEWGDKGVHNLRILQHKSKPKARILMRNSIGKVVLNASIYSKMKVRMTEKQKTCDLSIILFVDGEKKPTSSVLRVRKELGESLKKAIEDAANLS